MSTAQTRPPPNQARHPSHQSRWWSTRGGRSRPLWRGSYRDRQRETRQMPCIASITCTAQATLLQVAANAFQCSPPPSTRPCTSPSQAGGQQFHRSITPRGDALHLNPKLCTARATLPFSLPRQPVRVKRLTRPRLCSSPRAALPKDAGAAPTGQRLLPVMLATPPPLTCTSPSP